MMMAFGEFSSSQANDSMWLRFVGELPAWVDVPLYLRGQEQNSGSWGKEGKSCSDVQEGGWTII